MTTRRALLAASPALLAAACAPKPKAAAGRTAIRFATDWKAEAEHGGFYQALATGEYARRGLDVTIVPGGPGSNVPQLIATGAAELGIGSNAFQLLDLAKQKAPVKAVMAAFQKDPQVLMAHPDSGVAKLEDLKGDRPILVSASAVTSLWLWLKARYGVTDAQRRAYTYSPAPFIADRRSVQEGYVTSEPYIVEKAGGFKPEVFLLADHGYDGYAGMVLAGDALIAKDPKAVQAFVDASSAGWRTYLRGDPAAADAMILKDNSEMRPDILAQARDKLRSYAIVEPASGAIGTMTAARWSAFFAMAQGLGVAPAGLAPEAAYTLAFPPAAAKAA